MKIRHKKKPMRPAGPNLAWLIAATAMMQFSVSPPESTWAKEPNTEDPFDRKGAGRPDRWGKDPDDPYRPDNRWQPSELPLVPSLFNTSTRLVAQLTDKDKPIAFDIPPQPLSSALLRFGEQTGVQVAYTTEDTQGVKTAGVSGTHTVEQALVRLLADTGLQYRLTGANTITLEKSGAPMGAIMEPAVGIGAGAAIGQDQPSDTLSTEEIPAKPVKVPEIVVKEKKERAQVVDSPDGYKADVASEAVMRIPVSIQELPQSVSVVTKDSIRDRRAVTQAEALESVPGFMRTSSTGGALQSDAFVLRGFFSDTNQPGFTRDNGMLAFNNYVADPTLYERIEVIKGPASFTSGLVGAGGFVNRLLKAPLSQNFLVGEAGAGSAGHYRTTLDANGVMPNLPIAGRFVFTQNEDPEFFRNTGNQRFSFLPSVRFAPREDFSVTITGNVQRLRGKGNFGTPSTFEGTIPGGIEDSLLGKDNRLTIDYQSVHAEADKRFAQGFRLKLKGQYSRDESSYRYVFGTAFGSGGIGPSGNFDVYAYGRNFRRESFAGDINLTKDFSLFGQTSSIIVGADNTHARQLVNTLDFLNIGTGNLSNPDIQTTFPPAYLDGETRLQRDLRYKQTGAYIQGLLRPFNGTTLMVALRQNWVSQEAVATWIDPGARTLDEQKLTPQIGLSQRVVEGLNLYALYGTSFNPNLALTINGELLNAITSKTAEVGGKWEVLKNQLRITAAFFHTNLKNVSSPDPANPLFSIGGQSQRNQGFELAVQGNLRQNLRLNLAYTYVDAKITESTVEGATGARPFGAPTHTVSAFGRYDLSDLLTKGLAIGGIVYYRSGLSSFLPTDTYPGYTRMDLFVQYTLLKWMDLQVNVNNVFDEHYIEGPSSHSGFNHFGPPRHVIGMVRMTF